MGKCNVSFKEISLYADGRCSEKEREFIDSHIRGCSKCADELKAAKLVKNSLYQLSPIQESAGFDFEFNKLLEAHIAKKRSRVRDIKIRLQDVALRIRDSFVSPVPVAVRVAASLLIVVAVSSGIRYQSIQNMPVVEFTSGDVRIYRPAQKTWIVPTPSFKLRAGDKIESQEDSIINIASHDKYRARVKGDSLIVISKLNPGWRRVDTDFSISRGNIMINTSRGFKGSSMKIYTPACDAEVVGTAFMVEVSDSRTWIGVLEGKIKLISRVHPLKEGEAHRVATFVSSGQKVTIRPYFCSTVPELFSEVEWRVAQELYQLAESPKIMLLVGTGPDRIDDLFKHAPVYIPAVERRAVPSRIQNLIDTISNAAGVEEDTSVDSYLKELELLLGKYPNPKYNVEILMFIGSNYHAIHDYENALRVFRKVVTEHPDSSLASLAQFAVGTIYQQDLKDSVTAERTYKELIKAYPDSVEVIRAKQALASPR